MKLVKNLLIFSAFGSLSALADNEQSSKTEQKVQKYADEDEDDGASFKAKKKRSADTTIIKHDVRVTVGEPVEIYIGIYGMGNIKTYSTKFKSATENNDYTVSGFSRTFGANICMRAVADAYYKAAENEAKNEAKKELKKATTKEEKSEIEKAIKNNFGKTYDRLKGSYKIMEETTESQFNDISEKMKIGKPFTGCIILETVIKSQPADDRKSESPLKYYNSVIYEIPTSLSTFLGLSYYYKRHIFTLAGGFGISTTYLNDKIEMGGENSEKLEIKDFSCTTYGVGGYLKYDYNITEHLRAFGIVNFMAYGDGGVLKLGAGISHFLV